MRDCEHCIHKIPVLKDGKWTVECESFDCEFISREACLMAYRNAEPKSGNYFDKDGNYINIENLSLAEIYYRAFKEGQDSTEGGA